MRSRPRARLLAMAGLFALLLAGPAMSRAGATNDVVGSGKFWPFKSTPVTVEFGDNLDRNWDGYFEDALARWNKSTVIKSKRVNGSTNSECAPKDGTVQICNGSYGQSKGWLGLTQIRFTRSKITSATVQMNDSFFVSGNKYNDPRAKAHTMCHEMGHALGLDHVATKSCMNDSEQAIFDNTKPIARDFKQLEKIYSKKNSKQADKARTVAPAGEESGVLVLEQGDDPRETVTTQYLPDGTGIVTVTTWAD